MRDTVSLEVVATSSFFLFILRPLLSYPFFSSPFPFVSIAPRDFLRYRRERRRATRNATRLARARARAARSASSSFVLAFGRAGPMPSSSSSYARHRQHLTDHSLARHPSARSLPLARPSLSLSPPSRERGRPFSLRPIFRHRFSSPRAGW